MITVAFKININGRLSNEVRMERGIKQGCPLAMYLYILYIEPLHLTLQKKLEGVRLGNVDIKTTGFVDDIATFISSQNDMKITKEIVNKNEKCTNSKLNKKKTNILGLGKWEDKDWTWTEYSSKNETKILGLWFTKTIQTTINENTKKIINRINKKIESTNNRTLTLMQKILFTNTYVNPIFIHYCNILPMSRKTAKEIEQKCNNFIWRGRHERLAKEETYGQVMEGGLGVASVIAKARAHYAHSILKEYTKETDIGKMSSYMIGWSLREIKKPIDGPLKEKANCILWPAIKTIKEIKEKMEDKEKITELKVKDLYQIILQPYKKKPKIVEKFKETKI